MQALTKKKGTVNLIQTFPKLKLCMGHLQAWNGSNVYVCVQLSIHEDILPYTGLGSMLFNISLTYLHVYIWSFPVIFLFLPQSYLCFSIQLHTLAFVMVK